MQAVKLVPSDWRLHISATALHSLSSLMRLQVGAHVMQGGKSKNINFSSLNLSPSIFPVVFTLI
jgi:hypothetical protein